MKELWKPVPEFEGVYEVSNIGRVRRIEKASGTHFGNIIKPKPDNRGGYLGVHLSDGVRKKRKALHRLVAEVFIPNPLNLPEVNHLGPKSDCRASKLEWRSIEGNNLHRKQQNGKGVCFDVRKGKWRAYYNPELGKQIEIGNFSTKKEATQARKAATISITHVL